MRGRILSILLLVGLGFSVQAQMSNERCKWINVFNQPIELDSLSVVPGSIVVTDQDVKISHNISDGTIELTQTDTSKDSVQLCYKVYPFPLHQEFYNRNLSVYDSNAYFKDPVKNATTFKQEELFKTEGLYKSGSITRGVSFGNNQDVFVNSALNLNMDGELAENLFIRASITDQNVPYQPEGNTQQLQDFDNVLIEIYNDKFSLTGGDVVFKNSPSHFLRYYKNVQGGLANVKYNLAGSEAESEVGFSVAKGKFASVQIQPREGLAGPYRIPGPNNERFLLILANSERVFLDGIQLKRGFDNDYVIDYNSGELTFTNNVLITQFSRVRVDYEYSDQNYSRAITTAKHQQKIGGLTIGVNAYSERDNPNRPILYDLGNEEKLFLSEVGDSLNAAVFETIDSVGYSAESVLYRKLVINNNGSPLEIYEYSNNPDSAFYRVSFSEVGLGNGDYVQTSSTTNGRVFEFVPRINGVRQGQYSPTAILPAPNKRQMVSISGQYEINEYESVFTEIAISDRDENLYSTIDDSDNKGIAYKTGIQTRGREIGFLPGYTLNASFDFEQDDKNFNAIDRFRYIEFDRDWSFDPNADQRRFQDQIINAEVGISKDDNLILYSLSRRDRGEQVRGFQHRVRANQSFGKVRLRSSYYKMDNEVETFDASWERIYADLGFVGGVFIPGYIYSSDKNIVRTSEDSISSSAMFFEEHTAYITNGTQTGVTFDLRHSYRDDYRPAEGEIKAFSTSNTTRLSAQKSFENQTIKSIINYRKIDYLEDVLSEETISGRVDWLSNWLDNHIRSELTYSIANSQELKREFVFIKVPLGQGAHTWRDLNEDGVQDLSEFFEAINPDERQYAKIFTPTNEFVSAFQNLFIFRVNAQAPRSWSNAGGLKNFFSRFSNNTSWSTDTKTTDKSLESRMLAFATDIGDAELLAERNSLRSTMFYNRTHPVYGLDVTYSNSQNKQLLTNGFEERDLQEVISGARINIARQYSINLRSQRAIKEVNSDFLAERNYNIVSYRMNPQLSWQPTNSLRFSAQYAITEKENTESLESIEQATLNEIIGEIKYNKAIRSNISLQFRWVEIEFTGEENSPVGYDMLEALRPGQNMTWQVNWQQKITNGLQLNLSYNGRKSEDNAPIHIGRVQVSALF
ncbi:hypothetical protein [Fulvivirga lutea]|uniref:Cell surface protein SprA n=1 Tax=Fulvivirga lutea TaxID=2810512 RepID=A0A974WFZ3_9BACT|nr:hypothetical protein [Fulvivirga lutea]QSE97099.1 hypothetical protein JR347_16120 [Fulvivirga lutea]